MLRSMQIGVVGVSHQVAPLEVREKAARSVPTQGGSVPLVTCNRVELYVAGEGRQLAHQWLGGLGPEAYAHWGKACFRHLARVTAGLESALKGEADIQGQVKRAYQEAADRGPLPSELHYLFQKSLHLGKELRTRVPLYQNTPCYGPAIVELLRSHFETDCRLLVVGSSRINRRIMAAATRAGYSQIDWCVRSGVAPDHGHAPLVGFEALNRWQDYDVVVCATRCPHVLIEGSPNHRPKLLIDLSVPHNIDPALALLPRVTLINLDALHARMLSDVLPDSAWVVVENDLDERVARTSQKFALQPT